MLAAAAVFILLRGRIVPANGSRDNSRGNPWGLAALCTGPGRMYAKHSGYGLHSWLSVLLAFQLSNYVRILVILNSLDFVQFLSIFRCLRTLIAADTFNRFLQTLAGSGFAASHCLICYHVRMTLILGCCLHHWFPVLLFILWNYMLKYVWFLGIPDLLDSVQFLASFRCLRTLIAADTLNRFLQTLSGSGFAASHCLICYHVRMTFFLGCCLYCWFPVL
jgi:hypothetical protein